MIPISKNNKNIAPLFLFVVALLIISSWIITFSDYYILFNSSYNKFKQWYPRYHSSIYFFVQIFSWVPCLTKLFLLFSSLVFWLKRRKYVSVILAFISIFLLNDLFWWLAAEAFFILLFYFVKGKNPIPQFFPTLKDSHIIGAVVIVAFLVRLCWVFMTDNSGNGDAAARLSYAYTWATNFSYLSFMSQYKYLWTYFFLPSVDWLPLHFYLAGFVGWITNDWLYSPRILSAVFGAFSIVPLYKICLLRFNRNTAIIASIIFLFYGYHIFVSSLVLSGAIYLFFLLYAYYFIEKWYAGENGYLFYVTIVVCCCCWLRYEGWFFAAVLVIILPWVKKINWKTYLLFFCALGASIGFIMICEVLQGQRPLRGIVYSDYEVRIALQNEINRLQNMVAGFSPAYLPISFAAICALILYPLRLKSRREAILLGLYLFPMAPFLFKLANGTLTYQARYLVLYIVPLIPFIAYGFSFIKGKTLLPILFIYLIISNISFSKQVSQYKRLLKYPDGFMESATYARTISNGLFYVGYEEDLGNCNWVVYARMKHSAEPKTLDSLVKTYPKAENILKEQRKKGLRYKIDGSEIAQKSWDINSFNEKVDSNLITHVMIFPDGPLDDALQFSDTVEVYREDTFTCVFDKNGYMIYEITAN